MSFNRERTRYGKLARRLLLLITPPLVLLTVLMAIAIGCYEHSRNLQRQATYHEGIQSQLVELLAEPLHYFEHRIVATVAGTAIKSNDIRYIQIRDNLNNPIIELGGASVPLSTVKINFTDLKTHESNPVGSLSISFKKLSGSEFSLYLRPLVIALTSLLLLALLLYTAWVRMVSSPLEKLRIAMEQSHGGVEQRVELGNNDDEFGLIADTYNEMLGRVAQHRILIENLANYDQLTGLCNHREFGSIVKKLLVESADEYWFLFIDVDRFKWINDRYGHSIGDEVLKIIAVRLQRSLPNAVISRFGGDEFVAFMAVDGRSVEELLGHVKAEISQRLKVQHVELTPSICIGVSKNPDDACHYEELLQKADAAMYQAKILGRNAEYVYNDFLDELNKRRNRIVGIMQSIVTQDNIDVHFQPIVDSKISKMVSAEALMRITLPGNSDIPVDLFLQVAEEFGYIRQIDQLARHKALMYLADWQKAGLAIDELHINISPLNFNSSEFVNNIINDLKATGVKGSSLVIEITESVFIEDPTNAIQQLYKLKALGIRIALDDFGTGFSSLSMLTRFPVDILKLDQSFFRGEEAKNNHLVVHHIIALAHALNMSVIAEGIESDEVAIELNAKNCHLLQGFLYSRPLPADEFAFKYLCSKHKSNNNQPQIH